MRHLPFSFGRERVLIPVMAGDLNAQVGKLQKLVYLVVEPYLLSVRTTKIGFCNILHTVVYSCPVRVFDILCVAQLHGALTQQVK